MNAPATMPGRPESAMKGANTRGPDQDQEGHAGRAQRIAEHLAQHAPFQLAADDQHDRGEAAPTPAASTGVKMPV
jgi:hypothetical protein